VFAARSRDVPKLFGIAQPVSARNHLLLSAELGASLTTTGAQNCAAGAGTHSCPETVVFRTLAIVWLKGSLSQFCSLLKTLL
jgi:hypothetical protein